MSPKEKLAARSWRQPHLFSVQTALSLLFSARHTCSTHWFCINDLKQKTGRCLELYANYMWLVNYSLIVSREKPVCVHLLFQSKSSNDVIDTMTLNMPFKVIYGCVQIEQAFAVVDVPWSNARYSLSNRFGQVSGGFYGSWILTVLFCSWRAADGKVCQLLV